MNITQPLVIYLRSHSSASPFWLSLAICLTCANTTTFYGFFNFLLIFPTQFWEAIYIRVGHQSSSLPETRKVVPVGYFTIKHGRLKGRSGRRKKEKIQIQGRIFCLQRGKYNLYDPMSNASTHELQPICPIILFQTYLLFLPCKFTQNTAEDFFLGLICTKRYFSWGILYLQFSLRAGLTDTY